MTDADYMSQALREARAGSRKEVPVGAVAVTDGEIIARAHNRVITDRDPTAHAEIVVLREAARKTGNYRLNGIKIYATLEPCTMCYAAMVHARIDELIYGAADPKGGVFSTGAYEGMKNVFNHRIGVRGHILQEKSGELLRSFFQQRRDAGAAERGGLENR